MKSNYIFQLQDRVKQLEAIVSAAQDGLADLDRYVQSPKFSSGHALDSYVNTGDITRYVGNIRQAMGDAEVNTANETYRTRERQEQQRIANDRAADEFMERVERDAA